ncbi:MAG: nucleotidyl transferase AbiEii/AbiGii toxin family protein [Deltaproteobacteria bacterium]|nr:nucleotidyl transferase AbiEii/AbiGii toxin family protein [Deltaproteobacteria bacterium]
MSKALLSPERVIPPELREVVADLPYWFVIGGQAVRCFSPYRPTRDVDFGVLNAKNLNDLLEHLSQSGDVEILEKSDNTIHLRWQGIKISAFVLDLLAEHVEERRLTVTGILATKLHAILDRGTRRDFFDLYVTLQHQRQGIAECLAAMREVYRQPINEHLLLRALTYFDDAEREAPLPGEGRGDWPCVKNFFLKRVGDLLVPPERKLKIQSRRVDVGPER